MRKRFIWHIQTANINIRHYTSAKSDPCYCCLLSGNHYKNMSVQYTAIFHGCKNDNFQMKMFDIFLIFAQNIDCGFTLEPPPRGGSNEYPQFMF